MPVPKKHKTHSRTHSRRSHLALKIAHLARCSHCGAPVMPHVICGHCGYYKGKEVLNTLLKLEKKVKKAAGRKADQRRDEGKSEKPQTLEELSKKE